MMERRAMLCRSWILFRTFFYLSAVTLGGGLAMLPMMREEFVGTRQWMSDDEMVDTVAAMQSMPGIIATNMAVLIGYRIAGFTGAVAGALGAVLPPFVAIVVLASIVALYRRQAAVQSMFLGVRAAVSALILLAVIALAKKILSGGRRERWFASLMSLGSFVAIYLCGVNALWVIGGGAVLGALLAPHLKAGGAK